MSRDHAEGKLAGQVAVVTGAAHGIGFAVAQRLASEGAKLVIADIEGGNLAKAEASLRASDADVVSFTGDLSREETANALIETAVKAFGSIQILVNNAGGGVILPFLKHTPETLRKTIDRNLWTTIWCTRAALPRMLERKYGRIINMGADSVRNGIWEHAAYNGAKGGVHGLTTGLAREFATEGITVNAVAPCGVRTPIYDIFEREQPKLVEKFMSVVPMARPATMEEVASMVNYLASPEAGFVTGQVVSVNGGSTML